MAAIYHEIIVKGDEKVLRGFARGFKIGRGIRSGIFLCGEHPIDREHLKHLHVGREEHVHLICTAPLRKSILDAISEASDLGFEVLLDANIFRSYFEFECDTYSRDAAKAIKKVLDALPAGLKLVDYEPKETVDKKARGVELYSPVHDYRFTGKGKIDGDVEKLLATREALAANEFVKLHEIRIEHAD